MDCTNDDDDHRSQKLADSREHAAPWQNPSPGVPFNNVYQLQNVVCGMSVR